MRPGGHGQHRNRIETQDGRMASRFPALNSRSLRLQIALAVIAVVAIAALHVALQTGLVSFSSGASAERARAEPQAREPDSAAAEPVHRELIIKRGAAVSH